MSVKLIMEWDIDQEKESDYYQFVVNDFIPKIQQLGMIDIQFWYTTYGECKQIQASGVMADEGQATTVLNSDEWDDLFVRLDEMVDNYEQKLIPATGGFQL